MSNTLNRRLAWGLVMASLSFISLAGLGCVIPAYGDTQVELKKFNPQVISEEGCPVQVLVARTDMEIDAFGTPVAARHYIDYQNISGRQITAVKFRIGYVDDDGKIRQPYLNGDHRAEVAPGGQASQRWRGDKVDPRTAAIKIRVLKVKFADGGVWESAKAAETNSHQQEGFAPLTTENPGEAIAGEPVQFSDYGQSSYKGYPDRTMSGSVPLKSAPSTATGAPFAPNAFGSPGPQGASASTGAMPSDDAFGGEPTASAPKSSGASPMGSSSTPSWATGSPVPTPAAKPAAPAKAAIPIPNTPAETGAALDALLGTTSKPSSAAAPAAAPSAPSGTVAATSGSPAGSATTGGSPAPAPGAAPVPSATPPAAPSTAPLTASPAKAAPATSAPPAVKPDDLDKVLGL